MNLTDKLQSTYATRFSQTVEHLLSLLVVFLMLMAAALWTGQLFGHQVGGNAEKAGQSSSSLTDKPNEAQMEQLGLSANKVQLEPRDSASWNVTATDGTNLGVVVCSKPYAPEVKGFAGPTPLYVYIDQTGHISEMAAADNAETADFFHTAFHTLSPKWKGLTIHEAAELQVDAVSGATFSSKALIANVQQSMAARLKQSNEQTGEPIIGWAKTLAVTIVLLLGILASWRFRGHKILRMVQLLLNVGVLGFWCGQFLSLSLLRGWISSGLDPLAYLPTVLMLAVAIGMPLFRRKHHYCTWVCPFGSLQELTSRLPFPKIHCSPKVYQMMGRIRFGVFALLMLLLWTGMGAAVLDYEPFTAFMVTTASPAVMALAAVFVVASCFVPKLWCRCVCPMGSLLDLSEDTKS